MFTGIIENQSFVIRWNGSKLTVSRPFEVKHGQSISINGCCLSVSDFDNESMTFDVSPQTLSCTTFLKLQPKDKLNVERAMQLSDRLDGHLVTGHVDGVARIVSIKSFPDQTKQMIFEIKPQFTPWVAFKGSIAIDGISLTVNHIEENNVHVHLIPITLEKTTLGQKQIGDGVNVEFDLLAKYVVNKNPYMENVL